MSLQIPGVGTEQGPNYAFQLNNSLTLIDAHDHSPGKGVQIATSGLNIDADLSLNGFSLIDALTIVFTVSSSASTTPNSLSVAPGGEVPQQMDLWYTPNTGVPIQITKNGIVNTIASSIPGESYAAGTFFWTQEQDALPTTPANFDIGSITLRPNTALTAFGVTLSPASAIASQYSINLPLLPATKKIVTLDNSGNMVADYDVDNVTLQVITNTLSVKSINGATNIDAGTITTTQISPTAGITQGQLAASALAWRTQQFTLVTPSFTVRVATTANGTLGTAFANGQTVDGVVLATGNIILIKNQTTASDDGVYVVQASGTPVRSTSYDTFGELNYAAVSVTSGTVNASTNWFQNNILTSLSDNQSWSKSSTTEFIVPAGVNFLVADMTGGGGGGGGARILDAGGGGAAATSSYPFFIPVTPGDSLAMTVGNGGAGVFGIIGSTGTGTTGGTGGNTTIGHPTGAITSYMTSGATGGFGGTSNAPSPGAGGAGGSTYAVFVFGDIGPAPGGAGGSDGGGTGQPGLAAPATRFREGGLIIGAAGGTASSNTGGGGGGGTSNYGIGGAGANGVTPGAPANGGDAPSTHFGAGGGGGAGSPASSSARSGNGAPGVINIRYLKGAS